MYDTHWVHLLEYSILCKKSHDGLIWLGDISLYKENYKNESCCYQNEDNFDYHGIENALSGKEPNENEEMSFIPKRILVIQMK